MPTGAAPNPFRPYYIPPANDYLLDSIQSAANTAFSKASAISSTSSPSFSSSSSSSISSSTTSIFASAARELLGDLDYSDYLSEDGGNLSPVELTKKIVSNIGVKYVNQGLNQPFEVAITNLQCHYIPKKVTKRRANGMFNSGAKGRERRFDDDDDDVASVNSDDSEPAYFSNVSPLSSPSLRATSSHSSRRVTDRTGYPIDTPDIEGIRQPWELPLHKSSHVWDIIKVLWQKEGVWGLWKGQNVSFIHWMLTSTLESWTSSLLSAIFSLPDPALLTDAAAGSPDPLASIGIAVATSVITALILSPLDIVRTRLMITPSSYGPRNILPQLRSLGTYVSPPPLILPTLLHASFPTLILSSRPYIIHHRLGIDPVHSPGAYLTLSFLGSMAARFSRLPLETVLRRAQATIGTPGRPGPPEKTLVPVGRYVGIVGTMWLIIKEEQGEGGLGGVEGLFRGWRMGFWPEVGLMLLSLLGIGSGGEEGF